jgi:DNA-directed RNA polymerase specialized sigma24 family protein
VIKKIPTNQEVFAELYDEFMPKIFRYIRYKVNDEQMTEDLTSTVFKKAHCLSLFDYYFLYPASGDQFSAFLNRLVQVRRKGMSLSAGNVTLLTL